MGDLISLKEYKEKRKKKIFFSLMYSGSYYVPPESTNTESSLSKAWRDVLSNKLYLFRNIKTESSPPTCEDG